MLVESAIGDAYGFGFEYADENLSRNDLSQYLQHPRWGGLEPGQYTDDTQMSIAVAEFILESDSFGSESARGIAQKFVEVFKRDPRDGYSRGFQAILNRIATVDDFFREVDPCSDRSGGAMRAGPCGTCVDEFRVLTLSRIQAKITHDTPDGIAAAQAAALMTHYFLYDKGSKAELGEYLNAYVTGRDWSEPWAGRIKEQGWMDIRAAVTTIRCTDNLADALKMAVAFGGDTDTAASITMSAASCSREFYKNLPQHLYESLEDGAYGRRYLEELDQKLAARVRRGRE